MNKRAVFCLSVVVLAVFVGCSPRSSRKGMGTLWGKVTYKGNPLRGGTIHFVQGKAQPITRWIRGDGTYSAEVPVGPAKVAVETESVKYKDRDKMMEKWREEVGPDIVDKKQQKIDLPAMTAAKLVYTPIPERFSHPEKSGLRYEIIEGEQKQDFEMDPPPRD